MTRSNPPPPPKRRVWRITEAVPLGEFVDPDAPSAKPADAPRTPAERQAAGGWIVSSFELLHGTDVDDGPDTVTDAQFDELFSTAPPAPKPTDRPADPARPGAPLDRDSDR